MDSKEVIAKLIKIARNQQKIIEKLSQTVVPNASQSSAPPAQALPVGQETHKSPVMAINDRLPAQLRFLMPGTTTTDPASTSPIQSLVVKSNSVQIVWKGAKSQGVVSAVEKAVQAASQAMELPGSSYSVIP